jgi:hypothetical protein
VKADIDFVDSCQFSVANPPVIGPRRQQKQSSGKEIENWGLALKLTT